MHFRPKLIAAVVAASAATGANAGGIPVIDVANLLQTVQQVLNDITKIQNQVQQITQLQDQLRSLNGVRNLGDVFNSPTLMNYVPANAYVKFDALRSSGYAGLTSTAKALRDAGMVYNCLNLAGTAYRSDPEINTAAPGAKP